METFVKGELAVLQNAGYFEEWNGALGVVTGELQTRCSRNMLSMESETRVAYQVRPLIEGAVVLCCLPHQLRKLQDPHDAKERPEEQPMETTEYAMS